MGSVPAFVNRIIQISNSIAITNVISRIPLCSRISIRVGSQSLSIRELTGVNDDDLYDINYMRERDREFNKKATVSMLLDLLDCSVKEVESMVQRCPELKFVSSKNAQSNIQFFKEIGVSEEVLYHNPWLLKYKTGALSYKLDILKKMKLDDVSAVIPLLQFPITKLRNFALLTKKESCKVPHGNRLKYISEKLQCNLEDVCNVFQQHKFLFTIPFDRFSATMNLLLDAGVCPWHILNDMWIFRYSLNKTAERLNMAKQAGVTTIKPWMLRCSDKIFSNLLQRAAVKKELLGGGSVVEYLSQQLQCDTETVEYLNSKYPSILRVQVSKLKEVFDFVYAEGYTPQHVCQVPRILFHSLETTKSRLLELRDLGYNPHTLMVLCKTKRQYKQFVEQLKGKKNQQCN